MRPDAVPGGTTDPVYEEADDLLGLWMSRRMFGWMVGMPEHRSFDEWMEARAAVSRAEEGT